MTNGHRSLWVVIKDSVWTFPVVLFLILLVLTSLKISGTSIGIYHNYFFGDSTKDSNLVFGDPRSIRSDEWLVNTQLTIAQERQEYPRINKNIGEGMDMSIIGDTPYKDWSAVFKPQNFSFFVLPLEYAFALKWWLLLFLLIVSCYFFVLRLLPNKKLLSILLSVGFGFSPFIFWWYSSGTVIPLFCAFSLMTLFMRVINKENIPRIKSKRVTSSIYAVGLIYLMVTFALVMYPPYQIPVAIVLIFFCLGFVLNKLTISKEKLKSLLPQFFIVAGSIFVSLVIVATFVLTRLDAIKAIGGTAYPGDRITTSGGLNPLNITGTLLQPQLQYETQAFHFFNNQSEASNFILVMPLLLIPGFIILIKQYRKNKQVDLQFLLIQSVCLLFLARAFIPLGDPFYKLLFLQRVPHERLVMGIGLAGFIQMVLIIKNLHSIKIKKYLWVVLYSVAIISALTIIGFTIKGDYPNFIHNPLKIIVFCTVFASIPILLLLKRFIPAALIFFAFSLLSCWRIQPLYIGLGLINNGPITQEVQASSNPEDTWVGIDNIVLENMGLVSNRDSISGVNFYPDKEYWSKQLGDDNEYIYNRYAHVVFSTSDNATKSATLVQPDVFVVNLSCSSKIAEEVEFLISPNKLALECLSLKKTLDFPNFKLYLYQLSR